MGSGSVLHCFENIVVTNISLKSKGKIYQSLIKLHYPHYRIIKSLLYEWNANIFRDKGQTVSLVHKAMAFIKVFQLCKCNQMFEEMLVYRNLFYFCIMPFSVVSVNIFTYLIKCWIKSWCYTLKCFFFKCWLFFLSDTTGDWEFTLQLRKVTTLIQEDHWKIGLELGVRPPGWRIPTSKVKLHF